MSDTPIYDSMAHTLSIQTRRNIAQLEAMNKLRRLLLGEDAAA